MKENENFGVDDFCKVGNINRLSHRLHQSQGSKGIQIVECRHQVEGFLCMGPEFTVIIMTESTDNVIESSSMNTTIVHQ